LNPKRGTGLNFDRRRAGTGESSRAPFLLCRPTPIYTALKFGCGLQIQSSVFDDRLYELSYLPRYSESSVNSP